MKNIYKNIKIESLSDSTKVIWISRPDKLNALDEYTLKEIMNVIDKLKDEKQIKCLVMRGEGGKAFSAGGDLSNLRLKNSVEAIKFAKLGQKTTNEIENFPHPVIAAIDGYALGGGCEMALACDMRIATEKSIFSQPEIKLGIIPGWGGTQRLTRIVGFPKAKEMNYLGSKISAEEALNIGLINKLVENGKLDLEIMNISKKIERLSTTAISLIKETMNKGSQTNLETGLELEAAYFGTAITSEDGKKGINDFLNKQK